MMSINERIAKIKDKASLLAVKAATVATLISGTSIVSSCTKTKGNDDNRTKTCIVCKTRSRSIQKGENDRTKTSVVFRTKEEGGCSNPHNVILLENGDMLRQYVSIINPDKGAFLENGDKVTYNEDNIINIEYKDKDTYKRLDNIRESQEGQTRTSIVFRTKIEGDRNNTHNMILLENGDMLRQYVSDTKPDKGAFLENGDKVTYNGNGVINIVYKNKSNSGKMNINYSKGKDIID